MTILEVAVSGAILAVILLGIANFSTFTAKMNQSNNQSDSFAGIMSTIDNIIKTQECDTFLGGIPVPTSSGSSLPFVGFSVVPGFVLASPSPAPSGFAFGTGADPTSFQMTFINSVDTGVGSTATWSLDTFDMRIALKKVDSSGHAMAGTPMQIKDYTLNLWVDNTGTTVLPVGSGASEYGTCTYKKPVIFSGPVITPACMTTGGNFTVSWTMPASDTPALTLGPGWTGPAPVLSVGQTSVPLAAPNGNYPGNLYVSLVLTDSAGNSSASVTSNMVSAYPSPTVSAVFSPIATFSTVPMLTLDMQVTTNWTAAMGGTLSITNPPIVYPLASGANAAVPVNITTAVNPEAFNFTVVASNGCGTTAQSIATATYSTTSPCSCTPVPGGCPGIVTYPNGCGGTCTCPSACTGCPATSTYCAAAAPVPAADSCGNACGVGTEVATCPAPASCTAPSTADSCGTAGACPCTGSGASPSPSPASCFVSACAESLPGGPPLNNYNTCACTVACPLVTQSFVTTDPFAPAGTYSYCGGSQLGQGCGCLGGTPPGTQCFGPPCAVGTCLPDPLFPLSYICQ
jgi:hypothetical protein